MATCLRISIDRYYFAGKNKSDDLSDVNNNCLGKSLQLSNSVIKILKPLLLSFIDTCDTTDDYQFGFKKNNSTSLCTRAFKNLLTIIDKMESLLFACFIYFNKAFDNVDYYVAFVR